MKFLILLIISFLFVGCNEPEARKRLVILETGVNVSSEIAPFLCNDGHKSFLVGTLWDEDKIGHGTSLVKVISKRLNSKESCIVVYKTADRGVQSSVIVEAYASALMDLSDQDFNVLLLALEDVSYFYKEIEWFNSLLSKPDVEIVVAAGNSGVQLTENKECSIFPACLKPKLLNNKRFHIVGSTDGQFNKGSLVTVKRDSHFSNKSGTSFSAARYASELMD